MLSLPRLIPPFPALAALFFASSAAATDPSRPGPNASRSLAEYELSCYCNAAHGTPNGIVKMDSNGAILAACLSGRTADQLRNDGVPFTDSQIRLLLDWGLLTEER